MYALFWHPDLKHFLLRGLKSPGSYELADDWADYVCVDDSVAGFLDALALMGRKASEEGWRNWELTIEDAF